MSLLRKVAGGRRGFWCTACDELHVIPVGGEHGWGFNGDEEKPSFVPSVLIRCKATDRDDKAFDTVCHLYVTDGKIHYQPDCTHELKGQVVPMTDIDESI